MKEKRSKHIHDYTLQDMYKYYNHNYRDRLDEKEYSKVIKAFNSKLIDYIYNGACIEFPYSLGDLHIVKYKEKMKFDEKGNLMTKGKRKLIDWKATKELWEENEEAKKIKKLVSYDNIHSDGYKFRVKWKRYHTVRTNRLYNFIPARSFSRGINKFIKDNPNQSYYG